MSESNIIGCRLPTTVSKRNARIKVDERSEECYFRLLPGQLKPQIGNLAIVASANGFEVYIVTSLNAVTSRKNFSYVVGFVNTEMYNKELDQLDLKNKLYKQLMEKKKELGESAIFELLAEKNPEFKELLDAYKFL